MGRGASKPLHKLRDAAPRLRPRKVSRVGIATRACHRAAHCRLCLRKRLVDPMSIQDQGARERVVQLCDGDGELFGRAHRHVTATCRPSTGGSHPKRGSQLAIELRAKPGHTPRGSHSKRTQAPPSSSAIDIPNLHRHRHQLRRGVRAGSRGGGSSLGGSWGRNVASGQSPRAHANRGRRGLRSKLEETGRNPLRERRELSLFDRASGEITEGDPPMGCRRETGREAGPLRDESHDMPSQYRGVPHQRDVRGHQTGRREEREGAA